MLELAKDSNWKTQHNHAVLDEASKEKPGKRNQRRRGSSVIPPIGSQRWLDPELVIIDADGDE